MAKRSLVTWVFGAIPILLRNADTGQHKAILTGHTRGINSIAFSPDGKTLASGANWPRQYRPPVGCRDRSTQGGLIGHVERVNSIAFSPDGKTLAGGTGWKINTIHLWDVDTVDRRVLLPAYRFGQECSVQSGWGDDC